MIFSIKLFIMKKYLLFSIVTTILLLFSNTSFSQTVNLGILESFEGYTGAGAVTNAAGANWSGDVGTNIGAISGFGTPPFFNGNTYNANAVTAQCRKDLFRLYIHLNDLFVDYPATHAPAFGGGETITSGVYSIGGAGSIGGALTLDGGGNPNAFFIIKFYGAMTVGANAVVNLTGGTKSCNVFFIAQGAISVAADTNIKGNLFSKIGAVGLGANTVLEGRMFSMQGAIVNGVGAKASPPPGTCTIPILCESNCSASPAVDVLGVLSNYALYTKVGAVPNTSTSGIDGNIGSNVGDVSGFGDSVVIGSIIEAANTAQASIDIDNAYDSLMALPNTVPSDSGVLPIVLLAHSPVFGSVAPSGETINAGVYFIAGAGSLLGTLLLDGQNNPNAIFVFKFAGAFSVAAQAKMILINGARRCNVFFIGGAGVATGAIDIGAGAVLKGTFLSHGGACGSGADAFLAGRQLSTGGAVNTYSGIIYNNPVCITSISLNTPLIAAVNDTATINGFTGGTFTNVLSNDTLNGIAVVASQVTTALVSSTNEGITLSGTNVIVPAGTPAGTYTLVYSICQILNPTNCSQATVSVTVTTPVIAAVNDTATINGFTGGTFTNVLSNDTLNGVVVVASEVTTALVSSTNEGITLSGTNVIVPAGTPAGTYTLVYSICQILNPTNCSQATVSVTVTVPVIAAVNDIATINGFTGGTFTNVLSNDTLNGVAVVASEVSTTFMSSTNVGVTLSGTNVIVAPGTPVGTYTLIYKICEILNPTNCSQAFVTITIDCATISAPILTTTQPSCFVATGTITVSTPTGTGLTYSINNSTYQSSAIFSGLVANSYNVTVKNASGCISTATVAVINSQPTAPASATVAVTQPTCSVAGTITVSAPTGTGLTYSINNSTYQSSAIFSGLIANSYNVTVKNASGCISTATAVVINSQPTAPASATVAVTQPSCSVAGTITVLAPTGSGLTYSINNSTYQSSAIFSGLIANSYNVTVKNASGCISNATLVVVNATPVAPVMPTVVIVQPTCSVTTGSITVITPLGSTLSYSINGSVYQTSPIFSGLVSNSYNVTVKNGTCVSPVKIAVVNATAVAPVMPTVVIVQPTCSIAKGTITVTAPLGSTLSYSINGSVYQSSPIFSCLVTGTYTVTVKNGTCVSPAKAAVVNSQPATPATPTIVVTQLTCTPTNGIIKITAPLGTGLLYSINGSVYQSSPVFSNLAANCYSVTVKNSTCVSNAKVVTIFEQLSIAPTVPIGVAIKISNQLIGEDLKIVIAPNPSLNDFELGFKSANEENLTIRIIDQNGRLIKQLDASPQAPIRFGNELNSGCYFIEVTQGTIRKIVRAQKL